MPTYIPIINLKYPKGGDKRFLDLFMKLVEVDEALNFISNLPVIPSSAHEIKIEEKIKAIRGTTGIEGNVLDEEEIKKILNSKGAASLGEIEVLNSGKVHNFIIEWSANNPNGAITEPLIRQIHKYNTEDLPYPSNEPGQYRKFEVTYGYPPKKTPLKTASEIEREMRGLVDWINDNKAVDFPKAPEIIKGILAHYAVARIHPFADGNGRTARAIEALIFYHRAKVNDYCFYGISNYCYRNRERYIEELAKVDVSGDASEFLMFCVNGFYESINYVKNRITNVISELMLMDYVHYLRRTEKIPKSATEVIDFIITTKGIAYTDYFKRFFLNRSEETKRRYLNKFLELRLITIIEKGGVRESIIPNFDVLKTLRRMV